MRGIRPWSTMPIVSAKLLAIESRVRGHQDRHACALTPACAKMSFTIRAACGGRARRAGGHRRRSAPGVMHERRHAKTTRLFHALGVVLAGLVDEVVQARTYRSARRSALMPIDRPCTVHLDDEAEKLAARQLLVQVGLVGPRRQAAGALPGSTRRSHRRGPCRTRKQQQAVQTILMIVVLPAPLGPRKAKISPARTWEVEVIDRAASVPKSFVTPGHNSIIGRSPRRRLAAGRLRTGRNRGTFAAFGEKRDPALRPSGRRRSRTRPQQRKRDFLPKDQPVRPDPGPRFVTIFR